MVTAVFAMEGIDMKKRILSLLIVLCFVLSMGACTSSEPNTYLEYPGLAWGMSPEEVLEIFDIQEEDIVRHSVSMRSESYLLSDVEFFGEKSFRLVFNFLDLTYSPDFPEGGEEGGDCRLLNIRVYYPDDADMDKVFKNMKQAYGETVPEVYEYETTPIYRDSLREEPTEESDMLKLWAGPELSEVIPEDLSQQYRDMWKPYAPGLNDDNWEAVRENGRLVTASWVNNEEEGGGKGINLNAYNLAVYNALKEHMDNDQEAQ